MINKKALVTIITLICVFIFSFTAFADNNELFESQIEASGVNDLFDYLDDKQIDMLNSLGFDKIDFESAFSASPRKIADLFYQIITGEYTSVVNVTITAAVMIISVSVASQFFTQSDRTSKIVSAVAVICVSLSVILPLSACLSRVISAIELCADFMLALIPILATVLTVSGNPTAALSYNSLCFTAAQAVTQLSSKFIRPIIQISLSLSLMTGIGDTFNFEKFVAFVKKTVIFLMSLTSTLFITMLSIKGMLASSADSVAVRGIRFLIGNFIPVVGGAVSDAYASITGTLQLVKNTAAVFGIAAVGVIVAPVIIECLCWLFSVNILTMLSDMFAQEKVSSLLRSISSAITLLTVSLVFIFTVFVLSIGLVMIMKGNA